MTHTHSQSQNPEQKNTRLHASLILRAPLAVGYVVPSSNTTQVTPHRIGKLMALLCNT